MKIFIFLIFFWNRPKRWMSTVHAKSLQLCPALWDPIDCNRPGSSVHGILQARIFKRVAVPSSRGSFRPKDRTQVYCSSCTAGRFLTTEPPGKIFSRMGCLPTHSSILSWRIPWTEESGELQSMGLQSQTWLSNWYLTLSYFTLILATLCNNEMSTSCQKLGWSCEYQVAPQLWIWVLAVRGTQGKLHSVLSHDGI